MLRESEAHAESKDLIPARASTSPARSLHHGPALALPSVRIDPELPVPTLRTVLDQQVREADPALFEKLENNRVRCFACGHCCPIPEGQPGVCKVRFNRGGTLYVPWGYTAGTQCDPVEKKPFFHAHPGALAYSFGMLGCDLHCAYCQNWVTSQALRDPTAVSLPLEASPELLVRDAIAQGAKILVSTYNEPLITSEWAVAVFKQAKAAGLITGFVSNGNATPQVLEYLRPWLDLYKVDLKSFDDRHYHELGGRIAPILDSVRRIHESGLWLEIVTLLIPGFNDSADELRQLTEFLVGISPDIPWHVTAFHTDYKMQGEGQRNTNLEDLLRAVEIGRDSGLRYIYAGNLPGMVGEWEDTRCPQCHETLISRYGYHIEAYRLTSEGRCPHCAATLPGRWGRKFSGQITSHPFLPQNRTRFVTITSR